MEIADTYLNTVDMMRWYASSSCTLSNFVSESLVFLSRGYVKKFFVSFGWSLICFKCFSCLCRQSALDAVVELIGA